MTQADKKKNESIAKEILKLLFDISDYDWGAYPISLLPYPKDQMKSVISEYLKANAKTLAPMEIALIKCEYVSLADFIPDEDAKLVNSIHIRYDEYVKNKILMETIPLPEKLEGTTYIKRYLEILAKITLEKERLLDEIKVKRI